MHTKAELLELLRANRLRLTKRLGQHYLIDPHITRRLVEVCHLEPSDTVIEIGAGLGALTDLLAAQAKRVIAVEVDRAICELLRRRLADAGNVQVQCEDILSFPWAQHPGCVIVGAIPYPLRSPILVSLCEGALHLKVVWLGLQREVAQRLTASPGTKAYGRLTVLVQYRFEAALTMRIPRGAFFPQPQVDSSWVRLTPRRAPAVGVEDEAFFFEVVRAAFSQRRKMLLNCLMQLAAPRLSRDEAAAAIQAVGLPSRVRGEELSLEAFARLAEQVRTVRRSP